MRDLVSLERSLTTAKNSTAFLFNEEFDESVADYLILVGGVHIIQIRLCQLFSVTILQIFPEMPDEAVYRRVGTGQNIGVTWKDCLLILII